MHKPTPILLFLLVLHSFGIVNPGQTTSSRALLLMEDQLRERSRVAVLPKYPVEARKHKAQGIVVAEIGYDTTGQVTRIEIAQSSHALFAAPTISALKQWKFEPIVTPKRGTFGGRGKLTFYFYYKNGRGWCDSPLIFKKKENQAKQ